MWDGARFAAGDGAQAQSGWKWQFYDRQKSAQDLHHGRVQPRVRARTWIMVELDEQERIALVETYHRVARIELPNVTAHAALHAIVENQIALNLEPVVRAMDRLGKEGLTRHDAVHAIGSIVAEHLFDILRTDQNDDAATSRARYYVAVERLTAESWRRVEH